MKTAATHWKRAAPSMLTVAPMGRMKRLMRLDTPLFSSTHFIIRGRVAELRNTFVSEPQYLAFNTHTA